MTDTTTPPRRRGGRPPGDPAARRGITVGVRVSARELDAITSRAVAAGVTPCQWLREAALSRRLPSPPVPEVNRQEYSALARLGSNLNQLARAVNEGRPVTVPSALLQRLTGEVARLRLALIGAAPEEGEQ